MESSTRQKEALSAKSNPSCPGPPTKVLFPNNLRNSHRTIVPKLVVPAGLSLNSTSYIESAHLETGLCALVLPIEREGFQSGKLNRGVHGRESHRRHAAKIKWKRRIERNRGCSFADDMEKAAYSCAVIQLLIGKSAKPMQVSRHVGRTNQHEHIRRKTRCISYRDRGAVLRRSGCDGM
jgi:hypothetical protein